MSDIVDALYEQRRHNDGPLMWREAYEKGLRKGASLDELKPLAGIVKDGGMMAQMMVFDDKTGLWNRMREADVDRIVAALLGQHAT